MTRSKKLKNLTLLSLATVISCGAQNVFAHAGLRDAVNESTVTNWNAVRITHGCNSNVGGEGNGLPHKDVIALSVLFPNSADISKVIMRRSKITGDSTFATGQEPTLTDLSNDLIGSTNSIGIANTISTVMTGGAMFVNNRPLVDSLGNVRGWQSWAGPKPINGPVLLESAKTPGGKDISTNGTHDFGISSFKFKPTSCAKSLNVRLAVANWCLKGAKSYDKDDRADIWIGSLTTKFDAPTLMPNENASPIFWTTLSVNRDLVANPLPGTTSTYPSAPSRLINPSISTIPPTADNTPNTVVSGTTTPNRIYMTQYAKDNANPDLAGKTVLTYEAYPNVTTTYDSLKNQTTVANANTACSAANYDTVYIEPSNDDIDALLPLPKAAYPNGAGDFYWPTPTKK